MPAFVLGVAGRILVMAGDGEVGSRAPLLVLGAGVLVEERVAIQDVC